MNQTRPMLYVEGRDDKFAIINLLQRHSIDCEERTRAFNVSSSEGLNDKKTESVEALLDGMDFAIRQSRGRPIGFVIDADEDLPSRWRSIVGRLNETGFVCPDHPVATGTVLTANVQGITATVGIWLMPNNADNGMLEDFLTDLVRSGDTLLPHAEAATDNAIEIDRRFPQVQRSKAVIHTWLAWQVKPGLPFGTAITAHYLSHDTPTALAFVNWFRSLFGIDAPVVP